MEISLVGIEQAVEGLGYRNDKSPKSRLINTIRKRYLESGTVDAIGAIDTDALIDSMWDLGGDEKAIRSKRKNLNSIKSSVNADLNEAWELGQNPEGITIGPVNTFIMSDAAKDRILSSFSGTVNLEGGNSLDRVAEALKIVSEYLSNLPGGLEDDKLSNLKSLVEGLAEKFGGDTHPGEFELTAVQADTEAIDEEEIIEEDLLDEVEMDEDDSFDETDAAELLNEDEISGEMEDVEQLLEDETEIEEIIEDSDEETPFDDDTELDDIVEEDPDDYEEILEDDTEIVEIDESELVDVETGIDEIDDDEAAHSEEIDPDEMEIVEVADEEDAFEETEEVDLADEEELPEEAIGDTEVFEDEVTLEEIDEPEADDIEPEVEEIDEIVPEAEDDIEIMEESEITDDETDDSDGLDTEETEIVELADEDDGLEETEEVEFADEEELSEVETEDVEEFEEEVDPEEVEDEVDLEEIDEAEPDDIDAEEDDDVVEVMDEADVSELEEADILEDEDVLEEVDDAESPDYEEVAESGDEQMQNDLGLPLDQLADDEFKPDEDQKRLLAERFDGYLGAMERFYNQYIIIKKGTYTIGADDPDNDVMKEREISLPDFYMGKYPVTNALFEVFVERTGYKTTAEKLGFGYVYQGRFQKTVDPVTGLSRSTWNPTYTRKKVDGATWYQPSGPGSTLHQKRNHPVVQVSIRDARTFSAWTGKRLPTEIEWEAAARTLSGFIFPWGNEWKEGCCNLEKSGLSDTSPVDAHPQGSNEAGIADLLGNVLEWTADECEPKYALENPARFFIVKGGSWVSGDRTPLHTRNRFEIDFTANILGFRCLAD